MTYPQLKTTTFKVVVFYYRISS